MKRTTIALLTVPCLVACSAAPSPSHSVAHPSSAPVAAANAATPSSTPPGSPFYVIGELPTSVSLFAAGDRGFLVSSGGIELQLIGDEVDQDPLLKRGLPFSSEPWLSAVAVGGRYPDAFWLSTVQPINRSGFSSLWRWDGKNWQKHEALNESHYVFGIEPWAGGRLLALDQAGMSFDASFVVLSGDKRVAVPQFTKSNSKESYCVTRLKVDYWSTLPSGEVFALGLHCDPDQDYQELAVERWAAGATHSTIDIMPGIHEVGDPPSVIFEATGLAALSASDISIAAV
ncbi:MAG TPA: hypothetical protein VEQ58_05100, partial [Polyangiaceae bacterium]|nr:hypothetical protein [Polyangiaceae bacterium]